MQENNSLYYPKFCNKWNAYKLYDLAKWKNGLAFKNINFSDFGYPVIKIAELKNGLTTQTRYTKDKFDDTVKLIKGDMVFSWSGNPETSIDVFWYDLPTGWLNQHIFKITVKETVEDKYFYYLLKFLKPTFKQIATNKQTTGLGHITIADLKRIQVKLPEPCNQRQVSSILSALDDYIEVNQKINNKLEEIAQALFKQWIIDFNFPDENGTPYKDSGGTMIDSELGKIPKGWRVGKLSDIYNIYDSKRKPIASRQRSTMAKIYPYYGATSLMDYVEDFVFDGIYLLLGEDGTVIDENGMPILQYVWGKFWVNNHAHVLQGKDDYSTEFLYLLLRNTPVSGIITGAVQLKINQNNLSNLKIIIPAFDIVKEFNQLVNNIYLKIRTISEEQKILFNIRDSLLPKLMSGEIEASL